LPTKLVLAALQDDRAIHMLAGQPLWAPTAAANVPRMPSCACH
jgi:hypothetical protein